MMARLFELVIVGVTLAWGIALIAITAAGVKALWTLTM